MFVPNFDTGCDPTNPDLAEVVLSANRRWQSKKNWRRIWWNQAFFPGKGTNQRRQLWVCENQESIEYMIGYSWETRGYKSYVIDPKQRHWSCSQRMKVTVFFMKEAPHEPMSQKMRESEIIRAIRIDSYINLPYQSVPIRFFGSVTDTVMLETLKKNMQTKIPFSIRGWKIPHSSRTSPTDGILHGSDSKPPGVDGFFSQPPPEKTCRRAAVP